MIRAVYRVPSTHIQSVLKNMLSILGSGDSLPKGMTVSHHASSGVDSTIHIEVNPRRIGHSIGSILLLLFGEISLLPRTTLESLDIPERFRLQPAQGIRGLRKYLRVKNRPLFMTILKPAWMWDTRKRDQIVRTLIDGGIDIIKEDEILTNVSQFPLIKRAKEINTWSQYALESRGRPVVFCLNMMPAKENISDLIGKCVHEGVQAFLIHPWISGISGIEEIRRQYPDILLFAHPALGGSFFMCSPPRITPECLFGDIVSALGVDAVLYPASSGVYAISLRAEEKIRDKLQAMNIFPVPGGGMTPARIPALLRRYEADVIINAGRSIMYHPDGPASGLKAFYQAVSLVQQGKTYLDEKACPPELRKALETFS